MTYRTLEHTGRHALWLIAALAACESSSSSEAPRSGATSPCPDCIAGGETTDFGGDVVCEAGDLTLVQRDDALAREFGVDAVLTRLEQPLRTTFSWRRGRGGSVVAGYERETEAEIRVEVQGLSHGEWRGISNGEPCGDFLQLDSKIRLRTADGALSGSFERPLRIERDSGVAYLGALGVENSAAPIDLRDFTGTLDLKLDSERAHAGSVALWLAVGPDAAFGELYLEVEYFEADGTSGTTLTPLRGQWPSNGCDASSVPVDPDAAINPSDGRSARDYWEGQRARLVEIYPTSATWLDGSATQLDLQLGELDGACQERVRSTVYYVSAPLQIRSADGRLSATQPAQVWFSTDDDTFQGVGAGVVGESTARAAFLDQVSAPSVDWANDFEATFELYSNNSPGRTPSGDLQIIGFDGEEHNRLYMHWCSGEDCSTFPRPRAND